MELREQRSAGRVQRGVQVELGTNEKWRADRVGRSRRSKVAVCGTMWLKGCQCQLWWQTTRIVVALRLYHTTHQHQEGTRTIVDTYMDRMDRIERTWIKHQRASVDNLCNPVLSPHSFLIHSTRPFLPTFLPSFRQASFLSLQSGYWQLLLDPTAFGNDTRYSHG